MRNIILFLSLLISFTAFSNEYAVDSNKIEGIAFNDNSYLYADDLSSARSQDIYLDTGRIVIKEKAISKIQFLQLANGTKAAVMAIKKGGDMGGGGL